MLQTLLLAISPAIAIGFYLYWRDKYEREPLKLLILAAFLGVVSTFPAGLTNQFGVDLLNTHFSYLQNGDIGYHLFHIVLAFFIVGAGEELFKFLALKAGFFRKKEFDEPYDGIMYGAMVALGFAAMENIIYVSEGGIQTAIARMFTAVPMHACCGIIMGYYMGLSRFSNRRKTILLFKGWLFAALLHGFYDYFLFVNRFPLLAFGALVSLYLAVRLSNKAISLHQENSPFKPS